MRSVHERLKASVDALAQDRDALLAAMLGLASKMRDGSPCWCLAVEDEQMADDDSPDGRYGMFHQDACDHARNVVGDRWRPKAK